MSRAPDVAFVLAAGLGTRMRPLTDDRPKPMVELSGRPLIDHVLDRLFSAGIGRAVVNVHYKAEPLIAHLAARQARLGQRIEIADERAMLLDTGGGVKQALPRLGPEPFYIHNADTVWLEHEPANVPRLASAWNPDTMDGLLLLADRTTSIGYDGRGDFHLADDGRLRRRAGEEQSAFVFAGVSIAHPRLFADTPDGAFSLNLPWNRALAAGRLHGIVLDGIWMHVGTPGAVADAERLIEKSESEAP